MANRRTGAQMLSRLNVGGVSVEQYASKPNVRFRASTGGFVTETAARALAGSATEFEQVMMQVLQKNTVVHNVPSGNASVTITGLQPAALAFDKAAALAKSGAELDARGKALVQRLLDKYVVMIQQLAAEVLDQIVYTPKGEAVIAGSALAARMRYSNYTASDAAGLMKRYQQGQSNVLRRRYPYVTKENPSNAWTYPLFDERSGYHMPEYEIGRRMYTGASTLYDTSQVYGNTRFIRGYTGKFIDPSMSFRGRQWELPLDETAAIGGTRSLVEKAWMDTRPGFQSKLHRALQARGPMALSILMQTAAGLAGMGIDEALEHSRSALRAPYYERTFTLRDSVVEGVKRAGFNIMIGVDEKEFARNGKQVYWHYVEEGHEVVIPRPLGKGHPGEYEMVHTGNTVPARPFMRTLFERVKFEIMPLLEDELRTLGVITQQTAIRFLQGAKVSALGGKMGLGVR